MTDTPSTPDIGAAPGASDRNGLGDTGLRKGPGKRARSKAANRAAILEAGRRVFATLGYDVTTVRDIIRETDLAAGTFYNYFKSKEEVFEALSGESAIRFSERLADIRSQASDFETYIRTAFLAYFDFLATENAEGIEQGVPHKALIGVRVDTPELKAVIAEIRIDLERILGNDGASSVDTEYLTAAAVGIAREMGDLMLSRRPLDPKRTADFASNLLLAGAQGVGVGSTPAP